MSAPKPVAAPPRAAEYRLTLLADGTAQLESWPADVGRDPDGDELVVGDDQCPLQPEDRDGFEDDDGCAEYDNDRDRFDDADEACPNEPENFNGIDDTDGCPDRGRVVPGSPVELVDIVYFERDSAVIEPRWKALLDNVGQVLDTHDEILKVQVRGFASIDEAGGKWNAELKLAGKRATAIRQALIDRGVDDARLVVGGGGIGGLGDPQGNRNRELARRQSRAAQFVILERAPEPTPPLPPPAPPAVTPARWLPHDSIATVAVRDALLFDVRADPPDGYRQLRKAVTFVNTTGYALQESPITIVGRGTSRTMRTEPGQVVVLAFADATEEMTKVATTVVEEPRRIVEIVRSWITTETTVVSTTTYQAATPTGTALFVNHLTRPGKQRSLREITAANQTIEDRAPRRESINLFDGPLVEIEAALAASTLPPDIATAVRDVIAARKKLGKKPTDAALRKVRKLARAVRYVP